MAVPDRNSKTTIEKSTQNVLNRSFDEIYQVLAFMMLGFNSSASTVNRVSVNAGGELMVAGTDAYNYQYMGSQTSGDYVYYGFKENGGTHWKIMRKDTTDDSAWAYAYGTSGWTTAWADPTGESYGLPPDS